MEQLLRENYSVSHVISDILYRLKNRSITAMKLLRPNEPGLTATLIHLSSNWYNESNITIRYFPINLTKLLTQ